MNLTRATTSTVLILRVSYGVALLAAPRRVALRRLGEAASDAPVQVPLRGLGTREAMLHAGALIALRNRAALRPWLAASIAGGSALVTLLLALVAEQ